MEWGHFVGQSWTNIEKWKKVWNHDSTKGNTNNNICFKKPSVIGQNVTSIFPLFSCLYFSCIPVEVEVIAIEAAIWGTLLQGLLFGFWLTSVFFKVTTSGGKFYQFINLQRIFRNTFSLLHLYWSKHPRRSFWTGALLSFSLLRGFQTKMRRFTGLVDP